MKKKNYQRKRIVHRAKKRSPRRLHHRVISFFKGDGGIFVILLLGVAMAGAFALTGGILPQLNPNPSSADQVQIDEDSAKQSSESALQLVDIKVKPTNTPAPTPTPTLTQQQCVAQSAIAVVVDVSGSMHTIDVGQTKTRIARLKDALKSFLNNFSTETAVSLISFEDSAKVLVRFGKLGQNKTTLISAINDIPDDSSGATNMKDGLDKAITQLSDAKIAYPLYNQYTVFMSDGLPESGDCKWRQYSGTDGYDEGPFHYYTSGDPATTGIVPPLCLLPGINQEPTFFTHKWSPVTPSTTIKKTGKLFSLSMRELPNTSDPDYIYEKDTYDKTGDLMNSIASDPKSTYFISSPSTANLTSAYQDIASRVCPL